MDIDAIQAARTPFFLTFNRSLSQATTTFTAGHRWKCRLSYSPLLCYIYVFNFLCTTLFSSCSYCTTSFLTIILEDSVLHTATVGKKTPSQTSAHHLQIHYTSPTFFQMCNLYYKRYECRHHQLARWQPCRKASRGGQYLPCTSSPRRVEVDKPFPGVCGACERAMLASQQLMDMGH